MIIEQKLKSLGYLISENPPAPMGNYVTVRRSGNLLFTSGSGPLVDGKPVLQGRLGREVSLEEGYEAARATVPSLLSMIKAEVGDLDCIRIIKLLGFVSSDDNFFEQPKVINGASDLLVELYGEKGQHARAAVGTSVLPFNVPLEIEMVVEIEEEE